MTFLPLFPLPFGGVYPLDNYINVIVKADFFKFFKNSVVVTIIFVLLATTINAMIGYALGMLNFRGKAIIISTIVALSIIPTESIIINRFMTVNSLGMLNTYIGLAIPSVAYPMYMYLYYNHFKGMPKELQEAAIIDGASYWKIFTKIMMPLSKPIITTVAIMAFIRSWRLQNVDQTLMGAGLKLLSNGCPLCSMNSAQDGDDFLVGSAGGSGRTRERQCALRSPTIFAAAASIRDAS